MKNTIKYTLHIMNYVYISSVVMTCSAIFLRPNFGPKNRPPTPRNNFPNVLDFGKTKKTENKKKTIFRDSWLDRSWVLGKPKKNLEKQKKIRDFWLDPHPHKISVFFFSFWFSRFFLVFPKSKTYQAKSL